MQGGELRPVPQGLLPVDSSTTHDFSGLIDDRQIKRKLGIDQSPTALRWEELRKYALGVGQEPSNRSCDPW